MSTYYEKDFRREEKEARNPRRPSEVSADARYIVRHLWIIALLPMLAALLLWCTR